MAGTTEATVAAGIAGSDAVVKIKGPCTFSICDRIRQWLEQTCDVLPADIYFDLTRAERIDSTFAGFLVSFAVPKNNSPQTCVHLVAPTRLIVKALETMYLLSLFDVCEELDRSPCNWQELGKTDARPEDVADLVIESHEKLIQADDRNADVFRPVVDRFRADVDRRRSLE